MLVPILLKNDLGTLRNLNLLSQLSLEKGVFPADSRLAKVTPIL